MEDLEREVTEDYHADHSEYTFGEHTDMTQPFAYARFIPQVMRAAPKTLKAIKGAAYTSEVGEAVRSFNPTLTRALYGVTFTYLFADIAVHTYHAEGNKYIACGDSILWHSMASLAAPSLIVHQTVKHSSKVINLMKLSKRTSKYAPIVLGLGVIPFVVHPIDHAADWIMDNTYRRFIKNKN